MWVWIPIIVGLFFLAAITLAYLHGTLGCFLGYHRYDIVERAYTPPNTKLVPETLAVPRDRFTGAIIPGSTPGEKVIHGYTTLILKCTRCGNIHREEMLGKSTFSRIK